MKKLFAVALALLMSVSLSACDEGESGTTAGNLSSSQPSGEAQYPIVCEFEIDDVPGLLRVDSDNQASVTEMTVLSEDELENMGVDPKDAVITGFLIRSGNYRTEGEQYILTTDRFTGRMTFVGENVSAAKEAYLQAMSEDPEYYQLYADMVDGKEVKLPEIMGEPVRTIGFQLDGKQLISLVFYNDDGKSLDVVYTFHVSGTVKTEARYYDGEKYVEYTYDEFGQQISEWRPEEDWVDPGPTVVPNPPTAGTMDPDAPVPPEYSYEGCEYYPDGTVKVGFRYYKDGTLQERAEFSQAGVLSVRTLYHPDGTLQEREEYSEAGVLSVRTLYHEHEDGLVSVVETYDEKGRLISTDHYSRDPEGEGWYRRRCVYTDGVVTETTTYREDGSVVEQRRYQKDGESLAYSIEYYDNGNVAYESFHYDNGQCSRSLMYTEDGLLKEERQFRPDGSEKCWYDYNGGVLSNYRELDEQGNTVLDKMYYPSGALESEHHSNGGHTTYSCQYYEEGGKREEITYYDNGERKLETGYHKNGKVSRLTSYREDGTIESSLSYNDDGVLRSEATYNATGSPVSYKDYHENGNLCVSTTYYENGKNKLTEEFDADGQLWQRTSYHENGERSCVEEYHDGKLIQKVTYDEEGNEIDRFDSMGSGG